MCCHVAVKVAYAPCCACVLSCRGSKLGGLECDASVQSKDFQTLPVLSFWVKSSKWHLFLLRLILNTPKPSPLLQVNTDFVFSSPQPLNTASRHFQRREKKNLFALFLNSTWHGRWSGSTPMNLLTRVYKEASKKSAIQCKFAFFFFFSSYWHASRRTLCSEEAADISPGLLLNIPLL